MTHSAGATRIGHLGEALRQSGWQTVMNQTPITLEGRRLALRVCC
ncbi:hypothetical protein [Streptomyces shenzhenensis]